MKKKIHALLLAAGCAVVPQAHAGWFDWFTPGEWVSGLDTEGLYVGGALNVTKATGQMTRRLGGANDPGGFSIAEPGFITTALLRAGWRPLTFLGVEAQYGFALDDDMVENADNSQTMELDSLYGIYLKPQFNIGEGFALVGRVGYSDFGYTIKHQTDGVREFGDSGLAWGAGFQLKLSSTAQLGFEYTQHYDEDDGQVFGIGVVANFLFGAGGGEDDDYY